MTEPSEQFVQWFKDHPDIWAALNEAWEPKVGDWVVWGKRLALVTFVPRTATTTYLRVKFLEERETSEKREDLSWLPSLSDLLGMIEEAGYDIQGGNWTEDDERRYEFMGVDRRTIEHTWKGAWKMPGFAATWEIAAAELWWRVSREAE